MPRALLRGRASHFAISVRMRRFGRDASARSGSSATSGSSAGSGVSSSGIGTTFVPACGAFPPPDDQSQWPRFERVPSAIISALRPRRGGHESIRDHSSCAAACSPALAQGVAPQGTPKSSIPAGGLATPLTFTTTTCMVNCGWRAANCQTRCFVPTPPTPNPSFSPAPILRQTRHA